VKLHMKKLKTPKMPRRKWEKIQKQKTFKIHMKKGTYPISSLVKLHTKKFENRQNDKKKIEDSRTSKYENNFFFKFHKKQGKYPFSPLAKLHTIFFEDPQNDKKKN